MMRDLSILKEEIIYSLFEEEVKIIGESNLRDIVRGNVEFDYEESGHHLDITSTISLIASVGTIIDLGIKVYQKIYQKTQNIPKIEELQKETDKYLSEEIKKEIIQDDRILIYKEYDHLVL
ncbi:MAG: hypothetical protein AAGE84_21575 [Cyanobacteria bacterium P01_G01_bin.39]